MKTLSEKIKRRVLLASSKGGHWEQLIIISEAFSGYEKVYVTTDPSMKIPSDGQLIKTINDFSRSNPLRIFSSFYSAILLVKEVNPTIVVSTGAAPGLVVLLAARVLRKKTLWIDSIANTNDLSLSGRISLLFATKTISQWENVAKKYSNVNYWGGII